jgi:predicted nucleic acid-binding protein
MNDVLIDTCVPIDCLRGHAAAVAFVSSTTTPRMPMTHVIVAAELLAGARDKHEQGLIDSFLSGFDLVSPTDADALSALELYRRYHLSHAVDWPDCQIAVTALSWVSKSPLRT